MLVSADALTNMDLAKNTKEQRQRFYINIRVLIRPGRCLECPTERLGLV